MMGDWRILALGSAFFAGLTAVLAKMGLKELPSNYAMLIRTFVVVLLVGLLVAIRGEWKNPLQVSFRPIFFLILSGIATGISWLCYFRALELGPVSLVSTVDKASLAFAVLFAVLILGERLSWTGWIGFFLILAGTVLAVLPPPARG